MEIKVLGTGCKRCQELLERTQKAVEELGTQARVEYVKDMDKITEYTFITPALVINEKVAVVGKVPKVEEIKALLQEEM